MQNRTNELILNVVDSSELTTIDNSRPFPTVKDLASLSYTVYHQTYGSKLIYNISESGGNEPTLKPLEDSWKLIATAQYKVLSASSLSIGDGYHGAAYYNVRAKHLVVVHRGTELTNLGSLWADIKGVMFSRYTSHMKSAFRFTRLIVDTFWECGMSISVTGHSLGGWLSQTSGFFMKYPDLAEEFEGKESKNFTVDIIAHTVRSSVKKDSHHLHVVGFDSPGSLNIIERHLLKYIPRYSDDRLLPAKYLNCLDITTYFSSPNAINSANMHVGSLFMMPNITGKKGMLSSWLDTNEFIKYTFDSHNMKNIVRFWQSDEFDEKTLLKITDWPIGFKETNLHHKKIQMVVSELTKTKFAAELIDTRSIRMSIFDMAECEFLEKIHSLKSFGVVGENISWETMFIGKDIAEANNIFCKKFRCYSESKNIFEFFNSFRISDSQLLKVDDYRFEVDFFICLVKYFTRYNNFHLRTLVNEVISEFPKVYQAIYRAFSAEYMKNVPELQVQTFVALQEFLESSQYKVYQVVTTGSTLVCVAKILNTLKSNRFSFGGDDVGGFNVKQALFLNSDLLTILDRHVSISRIVPAKDDLKLILIENPSTTTATLKSLIEKVLQASSPLVKLLLVTSEKVNLNPCSYYLENQMSESDRAISFKDLSVEQQSVIVNSEIRFQGANIQLKNLISLDELQLNPNILEHTALVSLLSQSGKLFIGNAVTTLSEFERSYYIPRHFFKIILTEPKQLLSPLRGNSHFVLVISYDSNESRNNVLKFLLQKTDGMNIAPFEWQGSFDGYVPGEHKIILVAFRTQSANHSSFRSYFETVNLSGLWLIYDNSQWYWQFTFGKQNTNNFKISYDGRYDEREMLELQRSLVIVSDEPGMGKSTILKNFAEECKAVGSHTGKASWVIFVNLESSKDLLNETLPSATHLPKNIDSVIDFLCRVDGPSALGTCLFTYLLQQDGRVTIFFDGLDEVTVEIQSKVFNIAKILLDQTKAKVFIASRLHLRSSLESYFSNYINKFLPLTERERIDFLTKFWINHPDFSKYEKRSLDVINAYASNLLQELQTSLNIMQADSFIGVPLQLFMLGNIALPHVCSFYSKFHLTGCASDVVLQEHVVIFGNIFNLYQTFVSEKCRISLEEKCKLTQLSEHYPWHNRQLIESLIELHRIGSFFLLFPNELQSFKCSGDSILTREEIQVLLGVGMVHSGTIDLGSMQFIHRSLAEFFVADFLVSRLTMPHLKGQATEFLRKFIFLPQFDKIRFFVDHFISIQPQCDTIFRKCLDWQKEKLNIFETLSSSEDKEVFDLLERNVLHYAICYGDHNNGILWFLIQNQHLFHKTDVFGCGFLSYAVLLPNFMSQFHLLLPHVEFKDFVKCFHPELLTDDLPKLGWINWFSGQKVKRLNTLLAQNSSASTSSIRAEFNNEIQTEKPFFDSKQIEKFSEIIKTGHTTLPTDLIVASMRGDSDSIRPSTVEIFIEYMIGNLDSPAKCLQAFEIAMNKSGAAHVKVALQVYKKSRGQSVSGQMLDLMAHDNFSLFRKSIEFISEDSFIFEYDLWFHCTKKQQKEYFCAATSTKFLTFRRALNVMNGQSLQGSSVVDNFLKFYEKSTDEIVRKEILEIVRDNNDEVFAVAFRLKKFNSKTIWKFLPNEDKAQILEKHYDTLNKYVIAKIQSNTDTANIRLVKFLATICYSVGSDWQKKIEEDVKKVARVDLKPYKPKTTWIKKIKTF